MGNFLIICGISFCLYAFAFWRGYRFAKTEKKKKKKPTDYGHGDLPG